MWFLAQLVIAFQSEAGDDSDVNVHLNYHLIHANDPEEALTKALTLGEDYNYKYVNPLGEPMISAFRGLADLSEIYEPLEDGSEIYFEWHEVPASRVESFVLPRDALAVFQAPSGDDNA